MTMGSAVSAPDRLTIANLATARTIEAQFNPREFNFAIRTNYQQLQVPGAGYQQLQYINTGNITFPLDLYFRVVSDEEMQRRLDAEVFLLALCYPRRGAGTISQVAPPRALIVWANVSIQCVVRGLNIKASRFNVWGEIVEEAFSLELEEISDGQRFSEDVRRQGLMRASSEVVGGVGP